MVQLWFDASAIWGAYCLVQDAWPISSSFQYCTVHDTVRWARCLEGWGYLQKRHVSTRSLVWDEFKGKQKEGTLHGGGNCESHGTARRENMVWLRNRRVVWLEQRCEGGAWGAGGGGQKESWDIERKPNTETISWLRVQTLWVTQARDDFLSNFSFWNFQTYPQIKRIWPQITVHPTHGLSNEHLPHWSFSPFHCNVFFQNLWK